MMTTTRDGALMLQLRRLIGGSGVDVRGGGHTPRLFSGMYTASTTPPGKDLRSTPLFLK